MMDSIVAHALALLVGSLLLALVYEGLAGNESFSLPLANILVVTVVGTALSIWWGWTATISILGVYGLYSVLGGLLDRRGTGADGGRASPPHLPAEQGAPGNESRSPRASDDITDIVFRTDRSLAEIARVLDLQNPSFGGESYWEWVIGELGPVRIDVTRTHTRPPGEVETRLFLVDRGVVEADLRTQLVKRLRPLVPGTISCGRSRYLRGNDYDFLTVEEYG